MLDIGDIRFDEQFVPNTSIADLEE